MLIAQATLEYAGAAGLAALLATAEQTAYRLQANVREHPLIWVAAVIVFACLVVRRPR